MMLRHLKILEYALTSLLRRKWKNLTIAAVYTLTVTILASILFLTQSLRHEAITVLSDAPDLVVQRVSAGRHALIPTGYADSIRQLPGIGAVAPRVWGYYYDSLYKINFTLLGIGQEVPPLQHLSGRLPVQALECAIGAGIAEAFGIVIGDSLVLADQQNQTQLYKVTGLFSSASSLLTNDLILIPEAELRRFFGTPSNMATDLVVEVYNQQEIATLAKKIKFALPDTRPIGKTEILHTYDTVFNWRSGMLLTLFASALIAFCIMAWDKATGISAEEKHEIGILKAVGWDSSDVLLLKLWEGLAISFSSFIVGISLAYLHIFFFGAGALAPVMRGWSVLFPDFTLTPSIDLYQIFVLSVLTIIPYVAATLLPSWKTAVTDPDRVMRN